MKKLALLMGSLLIVGATASAKEAVAAPVVVEESKEVVVAPVVIVEEVKPAFRPNGSIGQELEYFGNQESAQDKDYLRFRPIQGNINLTEKVSADFRSRFKIGLHNDARQTGSDFRTRWYYKHGLLGDTKINMTSRLRFEKGSKFQAGINYDALNFAASTLGLDYIAEYNLAFGFADYFPSNDYFKVTKFDLCPSYSHMWRDGQGDNYANTLGADLNTSYKLPWGFSADLNIYAFNTWANLDRLVGSEGDYELTDSYATVAVEAYLYYSYKLLESADARANLMFLFEGGYDPYAWSSEKIYGIDEDISADNIQNGEKTDYVLYAMPELRVNYMATETTKLYAAVKGFYGNDETLGSKASNWKWQPRAVMGWTTKF